MEFGLVIWFIGLDKLQLALGSTVILFVLSLRNSWPYFTAAQLWESCSLLQFLVTELSALPVSTQFTSILSYFAVCYVTLAWLCYHELLVCSVMSDSVVTNITRLVHRMGIPLLAHSTLYNALLWTDEKPLPLSIPCLLYMYVAVWNWSLMLPSNIASLQHFTDSKILTFRHHVMLLLP
jgi:hypothetical protein